MSLEIDNKTYWIDYEKYQHDLLFKQYQEDFMWKTRGLGYCDVNSPNYPEYKIHIDKINTEILSEDKYKILRDKQNDIK